MIEQPRALITGGAGFLGSRLTRALLARGWRVSVFDDFSVGHRSDLGVAAQDPGCTVIEGDVACAAAVGAAVQAATPHVVYHLAAMHFIPACEGDPGRTLQTNVVGSQAVIDAARRMPSCRVVFASTADVYAPSNEPHDEDSHLAPPTLYGITKLTGEQLVEHAGRSGLDYAIARLFNLFGPGDRTPHVVPDVVRAAARGGPFVLGRLDAVRDFVHVDDAVCALMAIAAHRGSPRVFNVATGTGRSVRDVVDAVRATIGTQAQVCSDPARLRPAERPVLVGNAQRAMTGLGWQPRVVFADGIREVVSAALAAS